MGVVYGILGGVFGLLLLFAVGCGFGFYAMIVNPKSSSAGKSDDELTDYERTVRREEKVLRAMPNQEVSIVTFDNLTLRGNFIRAEGESKITMLCLHGYTSNGYAEFSMRAQAYLKSGYNVLLVNHRNHGPSDGKYVGFATLDRLDALKWLALIDELVPGGEIFITGVSMGGATAMQCADLDLPKSVKGIIEDCGFTNCEEEFAWRAKKVAGFAPKLTLKGIGLYMKIFAGYGLKDSCSLKSCQNAKVPMMFIHGNVDKVVPYEMGIACYEACVTEKEFVEFDNCEHAQAFYHDSELYINAVNRFIDKHKNH